MDTPKKYIYDGRILTKKQLRIAYGATEKVFNKMLKAIGDLVKIDFRKNLYPKEIRSLIEEHGEPDWSKIPELKNPH